MVSADNEKSGFGLLPINTDLIIVSAQPLGEYAIRVIPYMPAVGGNS